MIGIFAEVRSYNIAALHIYVPNASSSGGKVFSTLLAKPVLRSGAVIAFAPNFGRFIRVARPGISAANPWGIAPDMDSTGGRGNPDSAADGGFSGASGGRAAIWRRKG